ncbi:MAG TPA: hypothetical protein VGH63_05265 [Polyangia bacterium]|jgi:hypothetical protein
MIADRGVVRNGAKCLHQRRESAPRPWTIVHAAASEIVVCRTLRAGPNFEEPRRSEVSLMIRGRTKSLIKLVQEVHACAEQQERELAALRATVERLRSERDELVAQVRFATEQANRETRAAGSLRIELLARTSVPKERLDFCGDGQHGETTAVLPRPTFVPRRRIREDETERDVHG